MQNAHRRLSTPTVQRPRHTVICLMFNTRYVYRLTFTSTGTLPCLLSSEHSNATARNRVPDRRIGVGTDTGLPQVPRQGKRAWNRPWGLSSTKSTYRIPALRLGHSNDVRGICTKSRFLHHLFVPFLCRTLALFPPLTSMNWILACPNIIGKTHHSSSFGEAMSCQLCSHRAFSLFPLAILTESKW